MMGILKGHDLVSRAVREALCTFVSPPLCEQLIRRSLEAQGLAVIPESGVIIGEWVEGPLREHVEAAVGPDAADLLMMQLGPIAAHAAIASRSEPPATKAARPNGSGQTAREGFGLDQPAGQFLIVSDPPSDRALQDMLTQPILRRRSSNGVVNSNCPTHVPRQSSAGSKKPPSLNSLRRRLDSAAPIAIDSGTAETAVQTTSDTLPRVLAATRDPAIVSALAGQLEGQARVEHIADLVGLLDAFESPNGATSHILVVDHANASVHVSSIAAIGEDLAPGTTIVLWNADDQTWSEIDRERTPVCRWVRCSERTHLRDVGALCAMLLAYSPE